METQLQRQAPSITPPVKFGYMVEFATNNSVLGGFPSGSFRTDEKGHHREPDLDYPIRNEERARSRFPEANH